MINKDMPARAKCSYADKYQAKRKPRCGCTFVMQNGKQPWPSWRDGDEHYSSSRTI